MRAVRGSGVVGAVVLALALSACVAPAVGPDRPIDTEPVSSFELDAHGLTVHSRADSELRRVTFDEGGAAVTEFVARYLGEPEVSVLGGCVGVEVSEWAAFGVEVRQRTVPVVDAGAPVSVRIGLAGGETPILVTTPGDLALGDASSNLASWRASLPERDRIETDGGISFVFDPLDRDEHIREGGIGDLDEQGRLVRLRAPSTLEEPTC